MDADPLRPRRLITAYLDAHAGYDRVALEAPVRRSYPVMRPG